MRTPRFGTFSIVAHDAESGAWGVAVQSKFIAVGAVVPFAEAGAGAVATQALANTSYGPDGLALLRKGVSADEVVRRLTSADTGRDERQLGVVDANGAAASFTGTKCNAWAGHEVGNGFACQGNILVGPAVVHSMARAYETTSGDILDRLLAALSAGQREGGDRRGMQSAAILVAKKGGGYGGATDRWVDVRVDDHPHPIEELKRVFHLYDLTMLSREDPATLVRIQGETATTLQHDLLVLGYSPVGSTGAGTRPARRRSPGSSVSTISRTSSGTTGPSGRPSSPTCGNAPLRRPSAARGRRRSFRERWTAVRGPPPEEGPHRRRPLPSALGPSDRRRAAGLSLATRRARVAGCRSRRHPRVRDPRGPGFLPHRTRHSLLGGQRPGHAGRSHGVPRRRREGHRERTLITAPGRSRRAGRGGEGSPRWNRRSPRPRQERPAPPSPGSRRGSLRPASIRSCGSWPPGPRGGSRAGARGPARSTRPEAGAAPNRHRPHDGSP